MKSTKLVLLIVICGLSYAKNSFAQAGFLGRVGIGTYTDYVDETAVRNLGMYSVYTNYASADKINYKVNVLAEKSDAGSCSKSVMLKVSNGVSKQYIGSCSDNDGNKYSIHGNVSVGTFDGKKANVIYVEVKDAKNNIVGKNSVSDQL